MTSLRRIDVSTTSCACWEFAPPPPARPNILNLGPQYSKPSYAYENTYRWQEILSENTATGREQPTFHLISSNASSRNRTYATNYVASRATNLLSDCFILYQTAQYNQSSCLHENVSLRLCTCSGR